MNKKILQVRFVNFGGRFNRSVSQVLEYQDGINLSGSPFSVDYTPVFWCKEFAKLRSDVNAWLETLNSGDAPVPRIERNISNSGYCLFVKGADGADIKLPIFTRDLEAFQHPNIFGKEAEIYTPKKYEAKWKRLYPREFTSAEINEVAAYLPVQERVSSCINQLLQTESGGLEVHELIVYEV